MNLDYRNPFIQKCIMSQVLLPNELTLKIASYLEPSDLKSYSLVSRQCRECALEYLVFNVRDAEMVFNATKAGARKLRFIAINHGDSEPVVELARPRLMNQ